ncbi:hypothetical protein [Allokutzneria sp. NRRL B-24872]|uniref:hypothetical protein n=1 Tax=Allokutzneria sp. NRRL B-24872 TaxID=1137961 RepID=UPI001177E260|nr:hypothetical protein [Allokutzneria sp. NRRL B-24872]
MTEPEERDPAHRPRSVEAAVLAWAAVGALALVFGVANLLSGTDPAAPANSAALFGGLTVLWCAKNLRSGWRGPRIYLALAAPVLAYLVAAALVSGRALSSPALVLLLAGPLAVAGTVLMFLPEANAYVREMTRR